jgi:hypothetical protein
MQAWTDAFDAMLRTKHPGDMQFIPKPHVAILKTLWPGGVSVQGSICGSFPVYREDMPLDETPKDHAQIPSRLGRFMTPDHDDCVETITDPDKFVALANWWLEPAAGCSVSVQNGKLIVKKACEAIAYNLPAKYLIIPATANWIFLNGGDFVFMTEKEIVASMAHELGHYYMAHGSALPEDYNYFYQLTEQNQNGKPSPDPAMADLAAKAKRFDAFERFKLPPPVAGQEFHSALFLGRILQFHASFLAGIDKDSGDTTCKQAKDFNTVPLQPFPFGEVPSDQLSVYKEFETAAKKCFDLHTTEDTSTTFGTVTVAEDITKRVEGNFESFSDLLLPLPHNKSVTEVFHYLSDKIPEALAKRDDLKKTFWQDLAQKRLGWYTAEQEADQLSVEFLYELGLNPSDALVQMIKFASLLKSLQHDEGNGALPLDECMKIANAGWKDDAGNPVLVPMAAIFDSHHSVCFRMQEIVREIGAHNFTGQKPFLGPQVDQGQWPALAQDVKKAIGL